MSYGEYVLAIRRVTADHVKSLSDAAIEMDYMIDGWEEGWTPAKTARRILAALKEG